MPYTSRLNMNAALPHEQVTGSTATLPTAASEVAAAVCRLQHAVRDGVEALPTFPARPPDLQRTLGIDRNLAWKIHRLTHARTAAEAATFVPGAGAMTILAEALLRVGVPAPLIAAVSQTFESYDAAVRTHAGDRTTARQILEAETGGPDAGNDLGLRRAAFRAGAFVAGVRARVHLQTYVVAPSVRSGWSDLLAVRGFYDVQRLRPDSLFLMPRLKTARKGDAQFSEPPIRPLDPLSLGENVPLIRDFCSRPVPGFREVAREDGGIEDELAEWPVGRTAAVTLVAGIESRQHSRHVADAPGDRSRLGARLRVPCETLVLDQFVSRDLGGAEAPEVEVFSELSGDASWFTRRASGLRVPMSVQVQRLGTGLDGAASPDVPRYLQLLQFAFNAGRLDPQKFEGYRVRIEFPLLPTGVSLVRPKVLASR